MSYLGWAKEAGPAAGADTLSIPCTQQIHQWQNDELVPLETTVASGETDNHVTTGALTLTVATGTAVYFRVGDVVIIDSVTTTEKPNTYLVTDCTDANTLVLLFIAGTATGETASMTVRKIGQAFAEGTDIGDGTAGTAVARYRSTSISQTSNYPQIWYDVAKVTGSLMSTEVYGISDQLGYQVEKKFKELVIQMEGAFVYGQLHATLNSDRHTSGGLAYFVRDNATNATNGLYLTAAGAALTESMFNTLLENIWKQGGTPDTCFVNSTQKRYMNSWLTPYVRTERDNRIAGILTDQYQSDFGTINIVLDRNVRQSDLIVCTKDKLGIGPLKGNGKDRSFFLETLPKTGDHERAQIIGEYRSVCSPTQRCVVNNFSEFGEPCDGNAEPTHCEVGGVETEREALPTGDEATVRPQANEKLERLAEMTSPVGFSQEIGNFLGSYSLNGEIGKHSIEYGKNGKSPTNLKLVSLFVVPGTSRVLDELSGTDTTERQLGFEPVQQFGGSGPNSNLIVGGLMRTVVGNPTLPVYDSSEIPDLKVGQVDFRLRENCVTSFHTSIVTHNGEARNNTQTYSNNTDTFEIRNNTQAHGWYAFLATT